MFAPIYFWSFYRGGYPPRRGTPPHTVGTLSQINPPHDEGTLAICHHSRKNLRGYTGDLLPRLKIVTVPTHTRRLKHLPDRGYPRNLWIVSPRLNFLAPKTRF